MQTAIGYIRVSSESQASEGVSLEAQQARIRAYCDANGIELASVYCDAGISGSRADNRPELQRALDAVCRSGGILIVYSLSRLARSTKDTITIAERLEKSGADLASLSERLDTSTAAGKMVFRMLAVLAEFEKDQVAERTKSALQHKRAKGERVGTVPFGFDLADDGITLIPNPDEQATVETIRELRESGESFEHIAAVLTASGRKTKQGKTRWVHTSVRSIFLRSTV